MTTPVAARLPPHRLFFTLAGLGGIAVVGGVLASRLGLPAPFDGVPLGPWHGHEMVFGCFAAAFAGVLLTALPRWTGSPPVTPATVLALAGCWLAGRIGQLPFAVEDGSALVAVRGLSAVFPAALAVTAGVKIARAGDRRDALVPVILTALAVVDLLVSLERLPVDMGERLGLGAALSIATLVGGRVTPALTRHLGKSRGAEPELWRPPGLEAAVAVSTLVAVVAWGLDPNAPTTVAALTVAALAHALRLAGWSGVTTLARPSFLALHLGYAFLPFGFALTALAGHLDDIRFADAGFHAWGAGVLGLMCGAVQASVVRRHGGRALRVDRIADLACAAFLAAAVARTAALFLDDSSRAMVWAGAAWWLGQAGLIVSALRPTPALARDGSAAPPIEARAAPPM